MRQSALDQPPPTDPDPPSGSSKRAWWATVAERWLPESWVQSRVDPGRAGLLGLLLVGLVVAGIVAVTVWSQRPTAAPVSQLPERPPVLVSAPPVAPAIGPPMSSAEPPSLVVSVVGRVARPGLVEVRPGARVADALAAAGGPLPDTDITALNLARKVVDGEQLAVAVPGVPSAGHPPATGRVAGGSGDGKLDLNAADVEQLDQLPGIGRAMAERIVRWRTEHGRFASVDQLRDVGGIGRVRLTRLRDLVRV